MEALTIVLAVATVRGWRPAGLGAIGGLALLALIVAELVRCLIASRWSPEGYNLSARLLTDEQVVIIRFNVYNLNQVEYARLFDVSTTTVNVAVTGRGNFPGDPYDYITRTHLPSKFRDI